MRVARQAVGRTWAGLAGRGWAGEDAFRFFCPGWQGNDTTLRRSERETVRAKPWDLLVHGLRRKTQESGLPLEALPYPAV